MSVYYKFKSARDYDSIPIDGHFISVANLKERIFESKHLGRGTDFDLMVSNAQTDEEYIDEATLIPKNTSVLVRRIPGRPRKPIVTQEIESRSVDDKVEETSQLNEVTESSAMKFPEDSDWDEFGTELYAIPEVIPSLPPNIVPNASTSQVDEESKIKALVDTPALDWQRQGQDNFGPGRGFGRGQVGRMFAGRAFGRGGFEKKTPPPGYVCHRCKVPGHLIQHCPTNGDPNYDIKRVKPPTGIPRSMLMATPDGSYALPSGAVAVLKPNEAAFEKEIEGLPSTRQVTDIPPELCCPLCKEVMKDAVLTSKCCFSSFCDKCIRDYIISKSMCFCGFTNILADDLLPNKTVRVTISRFMESATSSADNPGSLMQAQDMESARSLPAKVSSPTLSATKEDHVLSPPQPLSEAHEKSAEDDEKQAISKSSQEKPVKPADISEITPESANAKKPTSQESAPPVEEPQERVPSSDQVKKKKKKKTRLPGNAAEAQWRSFQDMAPDNCMGGMPLGPSVYNSSAYNPYFNSMPWGVDGFMNSFPCPMPMMSYPQGPFDLTFGTVLPPDPFAGQGYMMPPPMVPQRDLSDLCMTGLNKNMSGLNKNVGPPPVGRDEAARKAESRRKHENENGREPRIRERESSKDHSAAETTQKSRTKLMSQATIVDRTERGRSPVRARSPARARSPVRPSSSACESSRRKSLPLLPPPPRLAKRKHEEEGEIVAKPRSSEPKQKPSVFSRISFPDSSKDGGRKKRMKSSEPPNGTKESAQPSHRSSLSRDEPKQPRSSTSEAVARKGAYDHESSEEDHHFKRRPSSLSRQDEDNEVRSSRSSRECSKERDHERVAKRR